MFADRTPAKIDNAWHQDWINLWLDLVQLHRGVQYAFQGGKDGMHMKRIHRLAGSDRSLFELQATRLLTSDDPWLCERGVNLGLLESMWNRLLTARARVNPTIANFRKADSIYDRLMAPSGSRAVPLLRAGEA
jgi:hypothetical protein